MSNTRSIWAWTGQIGRRCGTGLWVVTDSEASGGAESDTQPPRPSRPALAVARIRARRSRSAKRAIGSSASRLRPDWAANERRRKGRVTAHADAANTDAWP